MNILRLELITDYTTAPYNNFTKPSKNKYNIQTISFKSNIEINDNSFINSDGSLRFFARSLNKKIKKQNFNVIHFHSVHCGIIFLFVEILNFRFKNFRKSVFTIHNSKENYSLRNLIFFYVISFFVKKLVFCSKSSYYSFPLWIRNREKSFVIQNGISIKTKYNKNRNIDFIYVGRLISLKNIELILNIFKKFKGNCHIIGDGPLKDIVLDTSEKYNNIHFHGKVSRENVYKYLSNSKYFISLSKTEGLPITLLESIILGCMPIVSKIDPHKEILGQDFNYVDINTGFESLDHIIPLDKFELTSSKRKSIIERFSSEKMLENYHNLYKEL